MVEVPIPAKDWFPHGDGSPRIVCQDCAEDSEIVSWIWRDDAA